MTDCLFCKIVDGSVPADIVYSDDDVVAFRDISPAAPIHVLVVPREHFVNAVEIATEQPLLAAQVIAAAGKVAEIEGIAESGYRLIANTGLDSGQAVFHVHVHVLGGQRLEWPVAARTGQAGTA